MSVSSAASLVTSTAQLHALMDHVRAAGRFAFDTEFVSEETFEPVLCLIQVATRDRLALVDPLAVRDLDPFWDVVCDPSLEVVMHAAGEDLRICRIKTGPPAAHVFDVQIAAGLVGFSYPLSLGNLVSQVLGVSLAGGETRTDWRRRPLSTAQVRLRPGRRPLPARPGRLLHRRSRRSSAGPPGPRRSSPSSSKRSRSGPTRTAGGGCRA